MAFGITSSLPSQIEHQGVISVSQNLLFLFIFHKKPPCRGLIYSQNFYGLQSILGQFENLAVFYTIILGIRHPRQFCGMALRNGYSGGFTGLPEHDKIIEGKRIFDVF